MLPKIFAKLCKILPIFLLLVILLPLVSKPLLAYDSSANPPRSPLDYYIDTFRPAIQANEMNLESFVNETAKALIWGVPFYYITHSLLAFLYYPAVCTYKALANGAFDGVKCVSDGLRDIGITDTGLLNTISTIINNALHPQGSLVGTTKIAFNPIKIIASTTKDFLDLAPRNSLSTYAFFSWFGQKAGLITPAYAQGVGYTQMAALQGIWTQFRNFAYAFLAVGLVITGFMVMFRMKLSPQTVVSIQTAIPRIILTLILVTFSYAIAGLVMDLIWVFSLLFINILQPIYSKGNILGFPVSANNIRSCIMDHNAMFFFFCASPEIIVAVFAGLGSLLWAMSPPATVVGALIAAVLGFSSLAIIWVIILLILAIVFIIAAFKITWMLLKAFILFILYTLIGPLWICLGIIPGVSGFGSWFKNLLSQAIIFPTTVVLLLFSFIFMIGSGMSGATTIRLPLMGAWSVQHSLMVLGLGLFLFTPKLADVVQKMMKGAMLGESAIGAAVGFGGVAGWIGGGISKEMQGRVGQAIPTFTTEQARESWRRLRGLPTPSKEEPPPKTLTQTQAAQQTATTPAPSGGGTRRAPPTIT